MVTMNPYISFSTNAEEALNFYKQVFGGEVKISRFGDMPASPDMPVAEDQKNLVMHGVLEATDFLLMVADSAPNGGVTMGTNVSISLSGEDEATLTKYFEGLSEGATITQPLSKAPWGDTFGMLTDKFGIAWLVNISAPKA